MTSDKDATDPGLDGIEGANGSEDGELRKGETSNDTAKSSIDSMPKNVHDTDDKENEAETEDIIRDTPAIHIAQEPPSTPDDTLSLQDSILSSPRRPRLGSPGHSYRPFDRRFSARLSPSPLATPRPASPAFLTGRSRQPSALSTIFTSENGLVETPETPWEVFRWIKLRKLSGNAFSELGKRSYGRPTCMAVGSLIAVGTSKGLILIFDYNQNLQTIIGLGTKAAESGTVTAIALSADYSVVAGGHSNGNIFTWEIVRPAKPFLSISATNVDHLQGVQGDGHIIDASVLHVGFLGTRHTALVSADVTGMAFSHLATRGLGAIARTVKTARILGRYPETISVVAKPRKPSSVLAFGSLPLGNLEHAIDGLGLVAMLTPYLLVVVSTTPVAQTQYKASRPKALAAHGAMTGALTWYPAMKGKSESSNAKLAYCWLNVITIVEAIEIPNEVDKDAPPDLSFKHVNQWQYEESIVAMQWLNRSVLAVLTISQQLIVIEDSSLAVTDQSDLIKRHIYHADLFSRQLGQMVENLEQEDTTMHGVVADAFYMSFKAYKGRLFLLGFNDVSIGTLSNWADRLLALIEQGDFIGAIQLATSYHTGVAEHAVVGLPGDETVRHNLVREKLLEMTIASLKYAFGKNPDAGNRVSDIQLEHLARACFTACFQTKDFDFLYEEVYPWYADNNARQIFLGILESYIVEEDINTVPPVVLKDLVSVFVERGQSSRLEEILCLLNPATMDLEQVTLLCWKFKLYDALFYIWSQAIGDYTMVLKNLLAESQQDGEDEDGDIGSKIFPYLSYTLTGRVYPTGQTLPELVSSRAKSEVYHFLFSGSQGESYLYLRQALHLDASSFLSMLSEAYEDDFLDGNADMMSNSDGLTKEERFTLSLTRQYIVRILLEVLQSPEFDLDDTIYLDMFIARNQAKFPQFIRIPGSVLQKVMFNLCLYPSEEVAEDCQLSLEYLLSVYQPPDIFSFLPELERAGFYRVVKSIYRTEKQYAKLLQTCFKDTENPEGIFDCIQDCLRPNSGLNDRQRDEFRDILISQGEALLAADIGQAAKVVDQYVPNLHTVFVDLLETDTRRQYEYLQEILESDHSVDEKRRIIHDVFLEKYVCLLCEHNPHHVSEFIDSVDTSNLHLDHILPALENSGVIDAAVVLIAKDGQVRQAMNRLTQHLRYLEIALTSLVAGAAIGPDTDNAMENANDLVDSVEKYSKIGIWLCQTQSVDKQIPHSSKSINGTKGVAIHAPSSSLSFYELLWLDLLDAVVRIAKYNLQDDVVEIDSNHGNGTAHLAHFSRITQRLRIAVQDIFTALLVATSDSSNRKDNTKLSFLQILKAFLSRAAESSPSLAHLREVLGLVFSAYAYEENLLVLSNRLLQKDSFVQVEELAECRKKGWRPSSQTCNGCGQRVWGPGIGIDAWNTWYDKQDENSQDAKPVQVNIKGKGKSTSNEIEESIHFMVENDETRISSDSFGKEKSVEIAMPGNSTKTDRAVLRSNTRTIEDDTNKRALIVFSCRHIWHRECVQKVVQNGGRIGEQPGLNTNNLRCPLESTL